jgi:NTP pyrophosphatase (non-canonical NTP hydrolase)
MDALFLHALKLLENFKDEEVDVSKIEIGDTVVLRNGGKMIVNSFTFKEQSSTFCYKIGFEGVHVPQRNHNEVNYRSEAIGFGYKKNGDCGYYWSSFNNQSMFDIVQIIKKEKEPVKIFDLIRKWADDRNLIEGSTPAAQSEKFFEECGELTRGMVEDDIDQIKDAIGDCVVVLTILASQYGMTIEECIDAAYDEIKDRKGKMVGGVFVKDAM